MDNNNLWVGYTQSNATEQYCLADTEYYETKYSNAGELYHALVKEYGRCIGKQYLKKAGEPDKHVGWVFVKRMKYEDVPETFLCETWVSVYTEEPKTVIIEKFAEL